MADTVQIAMPQMGESVSEGTILTWHKQEGDWVDKDETIVEVSTDKVDAEVPAPQSGKLVKILAQEDETVEVGQALAELEPGEPPRATAPRRRRSRRPSPPKAAMAASRRLPRHRPRPRRRRPRPTRPALRSHGASRPHTASTSSRSAAAARAARS